MCHSSAGVSNLKRFPVGRANGSGDGVREWPFCAAMCNGRFPFLRSFTFASACGTCDSWSEGRGRSERRDTYTDVSERRSFGSPRMKSREARSGKKHTHLAVHHYLDVRDFVPADGGVEGLRRLRVVGCVDGERHRTRGEERYRQSVFHDNERRAQASGVRGVLRESGRIGYPD